MKSVPFFKKKHATNQTHWVSVEDGRLGAVIGVVSKNYNSNDFITGYGADSGIAFQQLVGDTGCAVCRTRFRR